MVIRMCWGDHPPPHFHVECGSDQSVIRFDTLELTKGALPRRVHALVVEWAMLHRAELRENWQRAERGEALEPIAPLE
jgi:hypothetical protein